MQRRDSRIALRSSEVDWELGMESVTEVVMSSESVMSSRRATRRSPKKSRLIRWANLKRG